MGMVQQSVQHCSGQCGVSSKGVVPLAEREVRGQNNGTVLVAFGDDLEEQVGLIT